MNKEYTYNIDKYTIGVDENGKDEIGLTIAIIKNGEINVLGNCYGENARCIDLLIKENQELKKQLKEYQLQNIDLRADIMIQKMAFPNELIKDKTFYDLYNMPTYEELLVQQKEFIKYLEDKINFYKINTQGYSMDLVEEILQKYKSIIGGNDV